MTRTEAIDNMGRSLEAAAETYNNAVRAEQAHCAVQAERLTGMANAAVNIARAWGELAALLPDRGDVDVPLGRPIPPRVIEEEG